MEEGGVRQIGDPGSIYEDPVHLFVAQFIGAYRINLIEGRLTKHRFLSDDQAIAFDVKMDDHEHVLMGIRPEHLRVGVVEEVHVKGEVILVESLGGSDLITLKVGQNELRGLSGGTGELHPLAGASFSPLRVYFFDAKNGVRIRPGPQTQ
jgi:multiple sugar transport system ATP-binding protein